MPKRREADGVDLALRWTVTEGLSPVRRDLHRAMLLTAARRASILQVRRDEVDFAKGVLVFKHMKTGGQMLFPMGTWLKSMLEARLADDAPLNSPWLWPSPTSESGRITEPKEPKRGLPSPHEYRHHARTLFIAAGVPYAESALLLGQRLPGHRADAFMPSTSWNAFGRTLRRWRPGCWRPQIIGDLPLDI